MYSSLFSALSRILGIVLILNGLTSASSALEIREILSEGACGANGVQTAAPTDLATDLEPGRTFLHVADTGNDRVYISSDSPSSCLFSFGTSGSGNGQLDEPRGIAVDSGGFIYVADTGNQRIQKFDTTFGKDLGDPIGLLDVFASAPAGTGPLGLSDPHGLGSDASDRIYVADTGNKRIVVFDTAGAYIQSFGIPEDGDGRNEPGEFIEPIDVAVCPDLGGLFPGRIYVLDRGREDFQIFDPLDDGAGYVVASGRSGSDIGQFSGPSGISVDYQCNVYVADTGNNRTQMFDRTGGFLEVIGAGEQNLPGGVAAEDSVGVYVANTGVDSVQQFNWIDLDTNGDSDPDSDADGLPDLWELEGIDADNDGVADLNLPGASPTHKDLYLEIDYMTSHQPLAEALADVVQAFAIAPVSNLDGVDGIALHLEVGEEIPHQDALDMWDDFNAIKATDFGTPAQQADAAVLMAKRLAYRYGLFVHEFSNQLGSSGLAGSGGNFVVSLGAAAWESDVMGHNVGSRKEQAGTLMHEFGHTLGLGHGGIDGANLKSNYLSVMSYWFQIPWVVNPTAPLGGRLDYSRQALPDLNEPMLDETQGVGLEQVIEPYDMTTWVLANGINAVGLARGALDWNGDGDAQDQGESLDLNNDRRCIGPGGANGLETIPANDDVQTGAFINDGPNRTCDSAAAADDDQVRPVGHVQEPILRGADDWAALKYSFRHQGGFFTSGNLTDEPELTAEEAARISDFWEEALQKDLRYAVKFVCVPEVGDAEDAVRPGNYRTVINVRNAGDRTEDVFKHAVIARSEDEDRGEVSALVIDTLEPGQAFSVDCQDIESLFESPGPVGDGFVVLESDVELDVSAVYTTDDSVDVEYVGPRWIGGPLPDLTVRLPQVTEVECMAIGDCLHTVVVEVWNPSGENVSEPFEVRVHTSQGLTTSLAVPFLAAGAMESLSAELGPGDSCFAPNCEVWARVDAAENVAESDETNNTAHRVDEEQQLYVYPAKFVCMPEVGPDAGAVQPGQYRTVINVHNPSEEDLVLRKHAVIARSEDQKRGPLSLAVEDSLAPGQALSVDCQDIHGLFGGGQAIGDGFLVIRSEQPLDVSAVYTATSNRNPLPKIDVETVLPRRVPADAPPPVAPELPDLIVELIDIANVQESCPGGPATCITQVDITVTNLGVAAAAASTARVSLDPAQSVIVAHPVGPLGPGASETFTVITPPGGSCFDPNCGVCARADEAGVVAESNESNNVLCAEAGG